MEASLLLLLAGCVAGTINVIAGGGSFLTLPLLIFLGLPASVANGTNRVALLLQNIAAVWSFNQNRVMEWRAVAWAAAPAALGAAVGSGLALRLEDAIFEKVLAVLMVVITLWSLWNPAFIKGRLAGSDLGSMVALGLAFFCVGIYGGFVQAGVGFFLLAATSMAGLDLVKGNAVKVLTVLVFTAVSLTLFALQGKVVWMSGLVLGAGMVMGGLLGARLIVKKGHAWVRRVVTATILVFAVLLWFR